MRKKTKSVKKMGHAAQNIKEGTCDELYPPHLDEIQGFREFLAKPEKSEAYSKLLESQCGADDDSQPVEQYDGTLGVTVAFVNAHQGPVGQTQWNDNLASIYTNPGNVSGVRWCTGTLISNDLFLTAGHCFDQTGGNWTRPKDNVTGATISPAEIATNKHVNFNYQVDSNGNLHAEQSFPILELVEYRLGNLDYAIVRLGGNPGATFGTTQISTTDAELNEMICIIGHPAGQPKRIEAGPVFDLHGDRIGYNDIDTLGGNSGSGILRALDGRIVGVHTNGGCTNPSGAGHNHGVRITSIINQSPTLQSLPQPTMPFSDIQTLPANDIQQTLPWRDVQTLPWKDRPPTAAWLDVQTSPWKDRPPTSPWLDRPTAAWLDQGPTSPWLDQIGTLKNIDDVKQPALDKQFSDQKIPGTDGFPRQPTFPQVLPGAGIPGGSRPFVLATPHHSTAWSQWQTAPAFGGGELHQQYESALAQIALLLEQGTSELETLHQQYQQLLAEYEALMGEPQQ